MFLRGCANILNSIGSEHLARIGRPPQHRLAGRIPGKDAAPVRGQQACGTTGRRRRPATPPVRRAPGPAAETIRGRPPGASQVMVLLFMARSFRPGRAARVAIGNVRVDLARVLVDVRRLRAAGSRRSRRGIADRRSSACDQVFAGNEAAAHLVFALRAGLEARDAALDAELDALVVAGLEMQAVVLARARPSSGRTAPRDSRRTPRPRRSRRRSARA